MNSFVTWLLARLNEPSTYAGLSSLVAGMTFIPQADLSITLKVLALLATVVPAVVAMLKAQAPAASVQADAKIIAAVPTKG